MAANVESMIYVRDTDRRGLGIVTDRYRTVQNREAFAFTDGLLGKR